MFFDEFMIQPAFIFIQPAAVKPVIGHGEKKGVWKGHEEVCD